MLTQPDTYSYPYSRTTGRHRAPRRPATGVAAVGSAWRGLRTRSASGAGLAVVGGGFALYVLLSSFAGPEMAATLPGGFDLGVVLGLLQLTAIFVTAVRRRRP